MSFSSGTYSLYATGNPVVTNSTISSTWANNTLDDIATALSTCMLKDGTQTATASVGFAQGIDVTTAATTPSTTFACFNTTATTVNAFGAASVALTIGHASAKAGFPGGINSTLSTDATSTTTGSIITAGGVGVAKSLWVGTTLNVAAASTLTGVVAIGLATSATTWLRLAGATTAISSMRMATGSGTPSSPVEGDTWTDGTNWYYRNAAAVTKTFAWV